MWLIILCVPLVLTDALKYHQSDYTVKPEIAEIVNYNRSYCRNITMGLVYHNRTFRAVNASLILLKDLSMTINMECQVYKFMSNEYRFFPITMNADACKDMEVDAFGIKESLKKSVNIDILCPIKKGLLKMTYGMVNFSNFPPYIPHGRYKVEVVISDQSNFVFELHAYGKVEDVPKHFAG